MFGFITKIWNPIAMKCRHGCLYCWAEAMKKGRLKDSPRYKDLKDLSQPKLVEKELHRHFKAGDYVFVEDMGDLFASDVPDVFIQQVLGIIYESPDAKFLLLTKNPWRMVAYQRSIPGNCLCGCTIETTRTTRQFSKAPATQGRYAAMRELNHPHKMICIEPIMDFSPVQFLCWIDEINPELVVFGYDNYNSGLPEPQLSKTNKFIEDLKALRAFKNVKLEILTKTLRETWQ